MRLLQSKTQQTAASLMASLFLTIFVAASVASLIVLLDRSGGEQVEDSDIRNRRSSSSSEEYVFRNRVHRVLWARGSRGQAQEVATRSPPLKAGYLTPMERRVLQDTFIAVKTTKKFHRERLDVVLKTWFTLAREQTWFFSDASDSWLSALSGDHLINTKCSPSHNRSALCCKMAKEITAFLQSKKKWFCHFDDDNYVNVAALARLLAKYDPEKEWYLGKTSVSEPLQVMDREAKKSKHVSFWFATGGAGVCLSRALASRAASLVSDGAFERAGDAIRLPDDVTLGFLSEHRLGVPLTRVAAFHSHLEPLRLIPEKDLSEQVSFSYSRSGEPEDYDSDNVVSVGGGVSRRKDPTRFMSLHCRLYPGSIKQC